MSQTQCRNVHTVWNLIKLCKSDDSCETDSRQVLGLFPQSHSGPRGVSITCSLLSVWTHPSLSQFWFSRSRSETDQIFNFCCSVSQTWGCWCYLWADLSVSALITGETPFSQAWSVGVAQSVHQMALCKFPAVTANSCWEQSINVWMNSAKAEPVGGVHIARGAGWSLWGPFCLSAQMCEQTF